MEISIIIQKVLGQTMCVASCFLTFEGISGRVKYSERRFKTPIDGVQSCRRVWFRHNSDGQVMRLSSLLSQRLPTKHLIRCVLAVPSTRGWMVSTHSWMVQPAHGPDFSIGQGECASPVPPPSQGGNQNIHNSFSWHRAQQEKTNLCNTTAQRQSISLVPQTSLRNSASIGEGAVRVWISRQRLDSPGN